MFWSGGKLLQRMPKILSDGAFDEKRIDCSAYTLRMGYEVYVSPAGRHMPQDVILLNEGQTFNIPPGQFALLLTQERLSMPNDVMGFINMKSKIKLRGLVNVSGFHVDPGYKGKLVFAVFNAGPKPVAIRQGEDCFLIWMATLSGPIRGYHKETGGFSHIESWMVNNIAGEVVALSALHDQQMALKQEVENMRLQSSVLVTLAITALVAFLVPIFFA